MSVTDESGEKAIILFSDGTGNSSAKLFKTNVWRMYEAVDLGPASPGKRKQIAFYDNGVGTSAFRPLAVLAGIFGFGLRRNILQIYRYTCRNYRPARGQMPGQEPFAGGDEIYGFGFSRGAFTMRLVIALIATQGLVAADDERSLNRMSRDAYRAFRAEFLPRKFKTPTRLWRGARAWISSRWRQMRGLETYDPSRNFRPLIPFVGVWDTVAAYGGPIVEITRGIDNWLYALSMPDYRLHPRVRRARHALAIDDARDAFHPLLWDEVHEDKLVSAGTVDSDRLRQVWFTGMHADVGGGYPDESLSFVSFLWMLGEAEGAGLRTLTVITDRFRALANSAGPLHDSRAGFGSYYRYQPRNIGAWVHPADTESIVTDPDLRDESGKPQGLLTKVHVHESVLARIANGTDGYAPFTLPGSIRVDPPEVGGERAIQSDNVTPVAPPGDLQTPPPMIAAPLRARIEDPQVGEARCVAFQAAWDLVWFRRVAYFAALFLTLLLVFMPLWVHRVWDPPLMADGRTWAGSLIRLLSVVTPQIIHPLIDTASNNSFYFLLLLGLLAGVLAWSKSLERRLNDRSRQVWRDTLDLTGPLPVAGPASWVQRLRTSTAYRRPIRFMKWRVMPLLAALGIVAALAWLALGIYTQLRLPGLERSSALCEPSAVSTPLVAETFTFSPGDTCKSIGASVQRGQGYIVELEVAEPWRDGSLQATPQGLGAGELGFAGYLGVPLRRLVASNYLQPVIEVRRPSGRVHMQPLVLERVGVGDIHWRGEFEAPRTGQFALFANDAVLPVPLSGIPLDHFYKDGAAGNHGLARVTIRRADVQGGWRADGSPGELSADGAATGER